MEETKRKKKGRRLSQPHNRANGTILLHPPRPAVSARGHPAFSWMNRRRKISNRFVTKIEDDFFFARPFFLPSSLMRLAAHNGGGTVGRGAVLWRRDRYLYSNNVTWLSVARRRLAPGGLILRWTGPPSTGPLWSVYGEGLGSGTRHTPVCTPLRSTGFHSA